MKRVSSECLCKLSVFVSLVFLRFNLEAVSSASVLPLAAVLIVEAFVFVFCLRHENCRCVGCCYCFGVLLHHCVAANGLFLNEELCLFHHKSCVLIWNVLFLLLFSMLAVVSTPEMHFCFIIKRNHDDDDDDYTTCITIAKL